MPLYEYRCNKCNEVFELFRPMERSSELGHCPKCNEPGKRIYSKQNFHSKELPKGHNLSATKRRELWNSNDQKDFRKLM